MIARIWKSHLDSEKIESYLTFARTYSIPMFKKQKGILGVAVLLKGEETQVLTFWKEARYIAEMENNPLYIRTVNEIVKSGVLKGSQTVEVFQVPIATMES